MPRIVQEGIQIKVLMNVGIIYRCFWSQADFRFHLDGIVDEPTVGIHSHQRCGIGRQKVSDKTLNFCMQGTG